MIKKMFFLGIFSMSMVTVSAQNAPKSAPKQEPIRTGHVVPMPQPMPLPMPNSNQKPQTLPGKNAKPTTPKRN